MLFLKSTVIWVSVLWLLCSSVTYAATRVALVIGNNDYQQRPLKNPVNDAKGIAAELRKLNFDVIEVINGNFDKMDDALEAFGNKAERAEIALVYYAGHGIQVDGNNYLVPLEARLRKRRDLRKLFNLQDMVLEAQQASQLGLVILDACRDNPFADKLTAKLGRSVGGRGLARVESTANNVMVAFATKEGNIAEDGEGLHSPYAAALINNISTRGVEVRHLFGRIRDDVMSDTAQRQQPFTYGTLGRELIYLGGEGRNESMPVRPSGSTASGSYQVAGGVDIDSLLEECEAHFSANRLTSGAGGNALECYTEVLEIRPGQPDALKGLTKIEDKYIAWARRELKRNKALRAQSFLVRLKSVNADREEVGELEDAISALQVSQKQTVAVSPQRPQTNPVKVQSQRASYEPEMVFFEGGRFQMGCVSGSECSDDESIHRVNVGSFYMAKTEVTQAQWKAVMGTNPSKFKGDSLPVENVSWNEAQEYIKKLNNKTGKRFRLPTEEKWEYAARGGGNKTKYPWGDEISHLRANYAAGETKPAGSFMEEGNGLYDTVGNVWEWTASCAASYISNSNNCVYRGGSWSNGPSYIRSASRLVLFSFTL